MARITAGPLFELAGDSTPIFADGEREYSHAARCLSYRRIAGGARFRVATAEGAELVAELCFVTPEVLRVRLYRPGEEPPLRSEMLVEGPEAAPGVSVQGDKETVTLAGRALEARVQRDPWRLSVHTPDGRRLFAEQTLDYALADPVALPMGFSTDGKGAPAFHESFALEPDEHLYGLGERFGPIDLRGQRVVFWTRDTRLTNTTGASYLNIPFFMSSRGYGVFVHHASKAVFEMGCPSALTGSFRVEDPYLDYFLVYGPHPKQVLARYHGLTGRSPVPPLWSFGVWMSRCMYMDRPQVEAIVERMRELGIPMDVLHLDPRWLKHRHQHHRDGCDFVWAEEAFPDPEGFLRWLAERGVKLSLWENPYIWRDSEMFREGDEKGYLVRMPDGTPARSLDNVPETGLLDFTNPAAARWWQAKHRPYLRMGVPTFKSDYGEGTPRDAVFFDGRTGAQAHNIYPLIYNRTVFEVIEQERGEAVVFGRSGYAGSQRYPINWTGDAQVSFGGMAGALRGGLGLSLSGIPFWSHDIGGFFNPDGLKLPDPTLYIRWAQFGLLSSHARFHGVGEREPWRYGDRAVEIVRDFARLRYRLLPYLWAHAQEAAHAAVPLVRPMWLEFPEDAGTYHLDRQYMLGPHLLVAPVLNEEGRCAVYLPSGRWYDFWTGAAVDGPRHLDLTVPLERVPIYVRDDSILPFAPDHDFVGQRAWDPLSVELRVRSRARLSLPAPEGRVEVRARRRGEELRLDLRASGQRLRIRLLEPSRLRDVRFEGDVQNASWKQRRTHALVSLELKGRGAVVAAL